MNSTTLKKAPVFKKKNYFSTPYDTTSEAIPWLVCHLQPEKCIYLETSWKPSSIYSKNNIQSHLNPNHWQMSNDNLYQNKNVAAILPQYSEKCSLLPVAAIVLAKFAAISYHIVARNVARTWACSVEFSIQLPLFKSGGKWCKQRE